MNLQPDRHGRATASKLIRKLAVGVAIAIGCGIFVFGFTSYCVVTVDPASQRPFDGFGRPLSEAPFFLRMAHPPDGLWTGWLWSAVDMIVFFGGLGVARGLLGWGMKDEA